MAEIGSAGHVQGAGRARPRHSRPRSVWFVSAPHKPAPRSLSPAGYGLVGAAILLGTIGVLAALGRDPVCPCGEVRLWYGRAGGPGNSQHLADWYSAMHVAHGMLAWPVFWLTSRHWPRPWLVLMGLVTAVGWEIAENSPLMIDAFGPTPAGASYHGDSIVNALSDVLFATFGFALAMRLRWTRVAALVVAIEIAVTVAIRDGFVLGTLAMIAPVPAVVDWQSRAAVAPGERAAPATNPRRAGFHESVDLIAGARPAPPG